MRRILLPIIVLAFLLSAMSSVSFADGVNEESNGDKVKPADIIKILEQQKQEELQQKQDKIDQLWKEVKDSVVKKDYETAIYKLEEILDLDETSEDAEKILEMLKGLSFQLTSQWKDGAKAGDRKVVVIKGVKFAFRWCPAGTFMMGAQERDDIKDPHRVTLPKGFWMMETEVTVGMFKAFVNDTGYESRGKTPEGWTGSGNAPEKNSKYSWHNPGFSQDDNHPVTCVSWNDAEAFCKWLSRKTGQNLELPTNVQWEYGCRAGTTGEFAGDLDEMAWYSKNSDMTTHPVGTKTPNAWGLYDMHGNVWEWCRDWNEFIPNGIVTNPDEISSGVLRNFRGGCWQDDPMFCHSALSLFHEQEGRYYYQGFRVVRGQ